MRRGHSEITADVLARLHSRKPNNGRPSGFAEDGARLPITGAGTTPQIEYVPPEGTATGHFSRWKHLRRADFASREEISAHIDALREEWDRR